MEIILSILLPLSFIALILMLIAIIVGAPTVGRYAGITALLLFICAVVIGSINAMQYTPENTEPTALDVYRGKTTLEITYRDSVAVDSVVVYKVR